VTTYKCPHCGYTDNMSDDAWAHHRLTSPKVHHDKFGRLLPVRIVTEDGDTLNICPGGCGTYVDELNVSKWCEPCQARLRREWEVVVG
jgi:hypothetical protein